MDIEKTIKNYAKIYRKALIAGKFPDIETEITSYRARLREMFASDAFKRYNICTSSDLCTDIKLVCMA